MLLNLFWSKCITTFTLSLPNVAARKVARTIEHGLIMWCNIKLHSPFANATFDLLFLLVCLHGFDVNLVVTVLSYHRQESKPQKNSCKFTAKKVPLTAPKALVNEKDRVRERERDVCVCVWKWDIEKQARYLVSINVARAN